MGFADTYLVTDKLLTIPEREIELLERHFGMPIPKGYREFMTQLGLGEYCDFVRVYPPLRILTEYEAARQRWQEDFCWHGGAHVLPREEVIQSVLIGDTIDGDQIITSPRIPAQLFVLSRHDDKICWMDEGLFEPLIWNGSGFAPQWCPFGYFQSFVDRAAITLFTHRRDLKSDDLANKFIDHWQQSELRQLREEGCRFLFLKSIGGRIQITQSDWDRRIGITIGFDKDHLAEVEAFLPILYFRGFNITNRSAC
jgi:hypothetical protein